MLVFDIETGSLPEEELRTTMPPFDVSKFPPPGEFDETKVRYGNTKDPAKRAEKLESARATHAQQVLDYEANLTAAKEQYEKDYIEKAALSPVSGRILAMGLHRTETNQSSVVDFQDEPAMLALFWKKYAQCREQSVPLVGFNIYGFDLPFLVKRSWIHSLDVPGTILASGRYWDSIFVDLMHVWACGRFGEFCSLDVVARAFGVGSKNGDGADFAKLWATDRPSAILYLQNDLQLTARVAARMGLI